MFTEHTEPNEAENYEVLSKFLMERMEHLYGGSSRALRDTHAKSHAAVRGRLEILDIDEALIKKDLANRTELDAPLVEAMSIKQGLFAGPGRYPVWLRFANGRGSVNNDGVSDTRSMSVKIIGVQGSRLPESHESKTQDIITQNGDVFFIETIAHYNSFLRAAFSSKLRMLLWLALHRGQWKTLKRITELSPRSLLTERYWSGSAYSLGRSPDPAGETCPDVDAVTYPAVIKYVFTPVATEEPHAVLVRQQRELPDDSVTDNYYRDDLLERLARPEARYCWDLGIQFQATGDMSIDDVTIPWSEERSPFFTVGRLTVEHQVIDFDRQFDFCENLRFSPWNGLHVHRPVGALNRLRRVVYPQVADYRHAKAGVTYVEPTGDESFEGG